MVLSSQRLRIGVVLERALSRRAMRDASIRERDMELVIISSTGSAITRRRPGQMLDRIVIDVNATEAASAIAAIKAAGEDHELVLLAPDPEAAHRAHGVPLDRIIATPSKDDVVGEVIVARLRELVPALQTPASGPRVPAALQARANAPRPAAPRPPVVPRAPRISRRELVVLGCSTGGPEALGVVLRQLPPNFPAPIVVVQHMPPNFTRLLADRLDRDCALTVREVSGSVTARKGEVWIAPGGRHIKLTNAVGHLDLDDGPAENSCRPSVDVLFRSAAEHFGGRAVAVVLTGMGDDGRRGAERLHAEGAHVIVQDEASSVVWGMPGAVVKFGLAHDVAPLSDVASVLCDQFLGAVVQHV